MKISYNWLKNYLHTDLPAKETAKILTLIGLEVEGMETWESVKGGLKGVVTGKVVECKKHPGADRLWITRVDVGSGTLLPIVCGAPNVSEGQMVPVALPGTTLYKGDESLTLKKTEIRGEISEGMICAEDELGLGDSHDGIMVLDPDTPTGIPAADYFKVETDTVFEIGLTPNRIDAASHIGVARDLAAYLNQEKDCCSVHWPSTEPFSPDNDDLPVEVIVENADACPRYSGITMNNVKPGPSPQWLQNRLKAIGQNPINNVVDITNFVLHEMGQPLHAFDADKITGNKVIIKTLPDGTPFKTLDGEILKMSNEDLMICNAQEGMCIAGVLGGFESGVTEKTTRIFIESACFSPASIRKTSKRHTINTDASFRFERGTDPNMTITALKRAALLIREITGGTISSGIIDHYPEPQNGYSVTLSTGYLQRLTGVEIPRKRVHRILRNLDIEIINETDDLYHLNVPAYRVDVQRPADVVEEIIRIYGYDKIPLPGKLQSSLSYSPHPDKEKLVHMLAGTLVSQGFNEIMANSLTAADYYRDSKSFPSGKSVKILNPLSSELNILRQTLLFGGLEAIQYNINHRRNQIKFFETGMVYCLDPKSNTSHPLEKYHEEEHLALFLSGPVNKPSWKIKPRETDFYFLKAHVDNLLGRTGIKTDNLTKEEIRNNDYLLEGLRYTLDRETLVVLGEVLPSILEKFEIEQRVFFASLRLATVMKSLEGYSITYQPPSRFPEVKRDLALLLEKQVHFEDIRNLAFDTERKLLKEVILFDVFEDPKLGENKKSYAVTFILQDPGRTLTDKQIDGAMKRLVSVFEKKLDARIR
ncbi:MAG: phenylalanine--tRNA ligase subunit beta [Chlorobi bacterium]|nr:phenylalanine--tRNA ligase subunit beta [Chlorobiota bacterium]